LSLSQVNRKLGAFDTVLLMGNNFGLVGNANTAKRFLKRLSGMTSEKARVIASTRDPYQTHLPEQRAYHARNRAKGRLPGQARIRVRYKKYVTAWFNLLMVSVAELRRLLRATGWQLASTLPGDGGRYIAILQKSRAR
jgi:hypothetical protein